LISNPKAGLNHASFFPSRTNAKSTIGSNSRPNSPPSKKSFFPIDQITRVIMVESAKVFSTILPDSAGEKNQGMTAAFTRQRFEFLN
jgi:hypothetical protein